MIGRKYEMDLLNDLLLKPSPSLVCIRGRRRIGKSTLVEAFGKKAKHFFEFQGLAPSSGSNNKAQLENFSKALSLKFKLPLKEFGDWGEAFEVLSHLLPKEKTVLFLDEISWMGKYDKDFPAKLKIAWDTSFKNHRNLILIICGSVSSWIKSNILNNTGFVGRLSLNLKLDELSIKESIELTRMSNSKHSPNEIAKLLSITGGVPKYLEEINIKKSIENNIETLALNKSGILFTEFEQIFNEIFEQRSSLYKKIILEILKGNRSPKSIADSLSIPFNGDFSESIDHLVESGFLSKDFSWNLKDTKQSSLSQLRIADNFLRFYLKNIDPIKNRIEKLPMKITALKNWDSIIGLQFENLIHKNYQDLLQLMKIDSTEIVQIGPFFQRNTLKQKGVQIDLLIQTKYNLLYLCEIKFKNKIGRETIDEVEQKNKNLKRPKNTTIRNALIYCGELTDEVDSSNFFDYTISFAKFF